MLGVYLQKNKDRGCGMLEWIDPQMCKRSLQIIPGLLKKINKLEARETEDVSETNMNNEVDIELKKLREKIGDESRKLKMYMMVLCIGVGFILMFK